MNAETREELRRIMLELKKPFPASVHEFREIPGSNKKWVFLAWQTVRERLDEIYPEWQSDYSEVQYLSNEAVCRCGITILGIRKEALGCVPISVISSNGKEMTRGSPPDRAVAEAFKNACETWGIGRYLDDQPFTIRYLWGQMAYLNDAACGEIRRLSEQYKIDNRPQANKLSKPADKLLITDEQKRKLWAIARNELKLNDEVTASLIMSFGYKSSKEIAANKYEAVITKLRQYQERSVLPAPTK